MGHVVTRAVGSEPIVNVDFFKEPLKEGLYLLCSDGLNGILSDDAIWSILKTNDNIEIKAKTLIAEANCAGGTDNITVVLLEVGI
jgi:protein phosphatase